MTGESPSRETVIWWARVTHWHWLGTSGRVSGQSSGDGGQGRQDSSLALVEDVWVRQGEKYRTCDSHKGAVPVSLYLVPVLSCLVPVLLDFVPVLFDLGLKGTGTWQCIPK